MTNRYKHSARHGNGHWYWQRVGAIALVFLTIWFAFLLVSLSGEHGGYSALIAKLGSPFNASMMILFVIAVSHHASLGMQVIVEDYLSSPIYHHTCMIAQRLFCIAMAVMGTVSVIKIMAASSAALVGAH